MSLLLQIPKLSAINLAIQISMGLILLIGIWFVRQEKYRAHGFCQSAVIILNLVPILLYMLPIFRRGVVPKLSQGIPDTLFYWAPTAHAVLGSVAELLGVYVILAAGTKLIPAAFRFTNFKRWMRTTLMVWWVSIALGIATFYIWHLSDVMPVRANAANSTTSKMAASVVTVAMKNFEFDPKEIKVAPGTTIRWKGSQGKHTVKSDDGLFESEVIPTDGEYSFKFEKEGRFNFYCALHGEPGGKEMAGTVIVSAH